MNVENNGVWGWEKASLEAALNIVEQSSKLDQNSPGVKYLQKRGLKIDHTNLADISELRFSSKVSRFHGQEGAALIGVIKNGDKTIGIQRIYISKNFTKDGESTVLGEFKGGYISFGKRPLNTLHIAESVETSLAVFLSLNEPTWSAVNAVNLVNMCPPKTVKTVHVWTTGKNYSGTSQEYANKLKELLLKKNINCYVHSPSEDVLGNQKSIDYLDVYNVDPNIIVNQVDEFEAIRKIAVPEYDLPALTDDYLPCTLRDWVHKHAERLNISPELIVVPFLSVIGSLLGRKIAIRPKMNDSWEVFANLWGLCIAPPGAKKSPALDLSLKMLKRIQENEYQKTDSGLKDNEEKILIISSTIKTLKRKIEKAADNEDLDEQKTLAEKLVQEKQKLKELKVQTPRYFTNSYSIEKLLDLMVDNPNGLLIYRDEISAILGSFDKKGHENDRQFLLEGWNGNGSFTHDTLSRGESRADGICITLLGGIQPTLVRQMIAEIKKGKSDDGFMQRFQLIAYPNQNIKGKYVDVEVPKELDGAVFELFKKVSALDESQHGTRDSGSLYVKLSKDAYVVYSRHMNKYEKELSEMDDSPFKSHMSKFGKLLAALILIFHVIDNIETGQKTDKAREHVVEMAIRWANLFEAHARKLYDIEYNFDSIAGFALAQKIKAGKVLNNLSLRSIYKNEWSNLRNLEEVEAAANFLQRHNWLKVQHDYSGIGRPSPKLVFNSKLENFLADQN